MKFVSLNDVREWFDQAVDLAEFNRTIGLRDVEAVNGRPVDLPYHLRIAVEEKARELAGPVPVDAFDSLPFFSLCKGLFLPLSGLAPERVAQFFGVFIPVGTVDRGQLLRRFLDRDLGLTLLQKMGC